MSPPPPLPPPSPPPPSPPPPAPPPPLSPVSSNHFVCNSPQCGPFFPDNILSAGDVARANELYYYVFREAGCLNLEYCRVGRLRVRLFHAPQRRRLSENNALVVEGFERGRFLPPPSPSLPPSLPPLPPVPPQAPPPAPPPRPYRSATVAANGECCVAGTYEDTACYTLAPFSLSDERVSPESNRTAGDVLVDAWLCTLTNPNGWVLYSVGSADFDRWGALTWTLVVAILIVLVFCGGAIVTAGCCAYSFIARILMARRVSLLGRRTEEVLALLRAGAEADADEARELATSARLRRVLGIGKWMALP